MYILAELYVPRALYTLRDEQKLSRWEQNGRTSVAVMEAIRGGAAETDSLMLPANYERKVKVFCWKSFPWSPLLLNSGIALKKGENGAEGTHAAQGSVRLTAAIEVNGEKVENGLKSSEM